MKRPFNRHRGSHGSVSRLTWFKIGLLGSFLLAAGSLYTPYPAKFVQVLSGSEAADSRKPQDAPRKTRRPKPAVAETPVPRPVHTLESLEPEAWSPQDSFAMPEIVLPPFPPALPETVSDGEFEHLNKLVNGINLKSTVKFTRGSTASQDRNKREAYLVRVGVEMLLPQAAEGPELLRANPKLDKVLAGYDRLMEKATVSRWFHALYLHKQNRIRKNASLVQKLLDRHNFYDTDTILEITAPDSGRKVLWIQADMDVVSDGSDGDRLPTMPEKIRKSDFYQPTTSYRWRKRTKTPNPLLEGWQARLDKLKKTPGSSAAAIERAQNRVAELKSHSFLLAEYDTFIVAPLVLKEGRDTGYRPQPGDYAAVIVGNRVFPAIVGDYGPNYKTGEASLRLCKMVNPRSTVYARAVSNLGVSYLIFPGSKEEENGPIDYERLNSRCRELLDELGGLGAEAEFQQAKDLLPQKPESTNKPG